MQRVVNAAASAVIVTLGIGGWFMVFSAAHQVAEEDRRRALASDCMEWLHESRVDRLQDGPDFASACMKYFANRSAAEAVRDAANWRERVEDARHL